MVFSKKKVLHFNLISDFPTLLLKSRCSLKKKKRYSPRIDLIIFHFFVATSSQPLKNVCSDFKLYLLFLRGARGNCLIRLTQYSPLRRSNFTISTTHGFTRVSPVVWVFYCLAICHFKRSRQACSALFLKIFTSIQFLPFQKEFLSLKKIKMFFYMLWMLLLQVMFKL